MIAQSIVSPFANANGVNKPKATAVKVEEHMTMTAKGLVPTHILQAFLREEAAMLRTVPTVDRIHI